MRGGEVSWWIFGLLCLAFVPIGLLAAPEAHVRKHLALSLLFFAVAGAYCIAWAIEQRRLRLRAMRGQLPEPTAGTRFVIVLGLLALMVFILARTR